MNAIKELCKNCQHQRQALNEPRNHRHCFVWNFRTFINETCQHFQVAEGLLPSLDDVHSFLKKFDAIQERTAKSKLQLP